MTAHDLKTAREVVAALDGIEAVSRLTGCRPKSVSAWQAKDLSFPPKTYVAMIQALAARGYTAPASLWRMEPAELPQQIPHPCAHGDAAGARLDEDIKPTQRADEVIEAAGSSRIAAAGG